MRRNKILSMLLCLFITISSSLITCLAEDEPDVKISLSSNSVSDTGTCVISIIPAGTKWNSDVIAAFFINLPNGWEVDGSTDKLEDLGDDAYMFINDDGEQSNDAYLYKNEDKNQYTVQFDYNKFSAGVAIPLKGIQDSGDITIEKFGPGFYMTNSGGFMEGLSEEIDSLTISPSSTGSGDDSVAESYIVSFNDPSAKQVVPGEIFTVPVKLTSTSNLAAAQFNLIPTNAEIVNVSDAQNTLNLTDATNPGTWSSSPKTDGSYLVSFFGNNAVANDGLVVATVEMKAIEKGTASLSIKNDGVVAKAGLISDGNGIAISNLNDLEPATVQVVDPEISVFELMSGIKMVEYTPSGTLSEGQTPMYDENAMYLFTDGNNTAYRYLVKSTDSIDNVRVDAVKAFSLGTGNAGTISGIRGDLNGSDTVNIIDAQIAYDIARGVYTEKAFSSKLTSDSVDMMHWIKADVTYNKVIDAGDARAIQYYIHNDSWDVSA